MLRRPTATAKALAFIALFASVSLPLFPFTAQAANTEDDYIGGATGSLATPGNWSLGTVPTVSNDAVFPASAATGQRTLTASNLTVGSLDDLSSGTTITIQTTTSTSTNSTLTLGGSGDLGNGVLGTDSTDLFYVANGGTFNINGPNGGSGTGVLNVALGQSGTFNVAGTGASTISANISGTGFVITKTGLGTLALSGTNTFTGGVTLNAGTLGINSAGALGTGTFTINGGAIINSSGGGTATTGNAMAWNGDFTYLGGTNLTLTGAVTLGNTRTVYAASQTLFVPGAIGDGGNAYGLTKSGAGTLSLSGTNTYTGATTVIQGTLTLNFGSGAAPTNNILSTSSTLILGGGTINASGKASTTDSQTFNGLTLNSGYSKVTAAPGGSGGTLGTVNYVFGAITHNTGGTVDFTLPTSGTYTTTTANTAGTILGGWATVGGTDWAVSAASGGTAAAISALTSYYPTATGGNTASNYVSKDVDVTTSPTVGGITPNSIRFADSTARTLTLTGTNVIGSGGILFATGASTSSKLTGGTLESGLTSGELFVTNNVAVTANPLSSAFADNGSTKGVFVKSGSAALTVTGVLSNTGGVYVNQSTLDLNANNSALAGQIIVGPNGFLNELSSDNSNSLGLNTAGNEVVVQNGGTFRFQNGMPANAAAKPLILNGLGGGNGAFDPYNYSGTFTGNIQLGSGASIALRPGTTAKTVTITSGVSELTGGNTSDLVLVRVNDTSVASGTLVLSGTSTYGGNTYITDGAAGTASSLFVVNLQGGTTATPNLPATTVLTLGGVTPLIGGATVGQAAGSGEGRVSLGTGAVPVTQTVAGLVSNGVSAYNSVYNGATTATTASSLIINTASGTTYTFGGILGAGTTVTGLTNGDLMTVTKQGSGTQILSGTSTYTGATTVSAGTLSIVGSINGSTSVSVGSTGALTLSNTAATTLADTATLTLVAGATFNLNAASGTSEIIGSLILDGTAEPNGIYTAAQLSAWDSSINFSSLNGETLTIGVVPEPSTYVGGLVLVAALGWSVRGRPTRRTA